MNSYAIRTVWQSVSDDNGGIGHIYGSFFWSREEAQKGCDGWGAPPAPKEHQAIIVDGKVFLLSNSVTVYANCDELERARALEKLTPKERKALGH